MYICKNNYIYIPYERLNKGAKRKHELNGPKKMATVEDQLLLQTQPCRTYSKPLREEAPKAQGTQIPLPKIK